jgi:predicted RNase H-like nuclease
MTPPLGVLEAGSFEEANKVAPTLMDGTKVSRQAWALAPTILEVAKLAQLEDRIIEVHPEVSFRAMAGQEFPFSKHSWNGITLRRAALATHGLVLPDTLEECGEVPAADILDALAAAWSARRFASGEACALPPTARPGQRGAISY